MTGTSSRPVRLCSIEGCAEEHDSRGWCHRHYGSWYRYGDPREVDRAAAARAAARAAVPRTPEAIEREMRDALARLGREVAEHQTAPAEERRGADQERRAEAGSEPTTQRRPG